jgi:hypothetical protein
MDEKLDQMIAERTGVRGFYRVAIENEDGSLAGDSGWKENQVTNLGFNEFLVKSLGSISGSLYLSYVALGTGAIPASDATSLAGEVSKRTTFTAATSNTSKALNITATFSSTGSFVTATKNISNIGLFNSSSSGTLFAGNTYASSSCATNQNVNVSYVISFT